VTAGTAVRRKLVVFLDCTVCLRFPLKPETVPIKLLQLQEKMRTWDLFGLRPFTNRVTRQRFHTPQILHPTRHQWLRTKGSIFSKNK